MIKGEVGSCSVLHFLSIGQPLSTSLVTLGDFNVGMPL